MSAVVARKEVSDRQIREALALSGGMISQAAHFLSISPQTLHRRLKANPRLGYSARRLQAERNIQIKMTLFRLAISGNTRALKFYCRHEMGWGRPEVPTLRPLNEKEKTRAKRGSK